MIKPADGQKGKNWGNDQHFDAFLATPADIHIPYDLKSLNEGEGMALKRLSMIFAISPKGFGRHRPHYNREKARSSAPHDRQGRKAKAAQKSRAAVRKQAQLPWQRNS